MKKYNSKLAFSLIELSIVILIIGILVIGISKGSRIIKASRLRAAQSLTTASPVASTDGIMLWYESTLDKSFNAGEAVDTAIGNTGTISTWKDINPQTTTINNATQGTGGDMPRYLASAINGLPALNFDGVTDFLSFDGSRLVGTNYTIFIVEQRRAAVAGWYLSGTTTSTNTNLHSGYPASNQLWFNQYGNDYQVAVPNYSSPTPRIITLRFSSSLGRNLFINSVGPSAGGTTQSLLSYTNARIGGGAASTPYNGDIAEVIMFTRYLTETERLNIEKYLKTKWGIK